MKNSTVLNGFNGHKTIDFTPSQPQSSIAIRKGKYDEEVFSALDLYNRNIKELPKLLGELIPKVGIILLAGSSDTGKSIFARDLLLSLVLNKAEFIGFPFAENLFRKAIIVCTEDDDLAISYLIRKQLQDESEELKLLCLQNLYFLFDSENLIDRLNSILTKDRIDIIKIDTLGDLVNDIKDNGETRKLLSSMKKLAMNYQCLILLMHHTNKRTESLVPNKSNIQGAGGLEQKCRLVLELRNDLNDSNLKHLSVLKGNYLGAEYKHSSFVLECDPLSLTFKNTGQRIPFEDLIDSQKVNSRPTKNTLPDYSDIDHHRWRMILSPIFKKYSNGLLRNQLITILTVELKAWYNLETAPGKNKVSELITRLQLDGILSDPATGGLRGKAAIINLIPFTEPD
ncbi:AAA family ATPase [Albibacterium bauzanense]|uniref:AAA domain-containing protein n=1 Tax=Albibacterium bauzanense TaxID=653929 RepID=A0A4R1LU67_9SPHI|nr:AAA family ATPase [Albibacterium bauzanense]TCK82896.1 AAA domain-containing protein [Albibacterium bauzanense]